MPIRVRRTARRPRQPQRQRPNSSAPKTSHDGDREDRLVGEMLGKQVIDEEHAADQGQGQEDEADPDQAEQQRFGHGQRGQGADQAGVDPVPAQGAFLQGQQDRQQGGNAEQAVGEQGETHVQLDLPFHRLAIVAGA